MKGKAWIFFALLMFTSASTLAAPVTDISVDNPQLVAMDDYDDDDIYDDDDYDDDDYDDDDDDD